MKCLNLNIERTTYFNSLRTEFILAPFGMPNSVLINNEMIYKVFLILTSTFQTWKDIVCKTTNFCLKVRLITLLLGKLGNVEDEYEMKLKIVSMSFFRT